MLVAGIVLFLAYLGCAFPGSAQIRVEGLSLGDPSIAGLFRHVPHKLRISGVLPTDSVGFKRGSVRTRGGNEPVVNAPTDALADTLLVYRAGEAIFREAYRIASDRDLAVSLGAMKLTGVKTAAVRDLTERDRLVITTGKYRSDGIQVCGYELSIVKDGVYSTYGTTTGPVIGTSQRAQLASRAAGAHKDAGPGG